MIPGITTEQMIKVDRIMMKDYGIPVELMMEHAGVNFARFAVTQGDSYVVVAGNGNNGAGGLTAARKLIGWGCNVVIALPKGRTKLRKTASEQLDRVLEIASTTTIIEDMQELQNYLQKKLVVLDAYIGYGFQGHLDQQSIEVLELLQKNTVISLDAPSGMNTTTGENLGGLHSRATLTLAFPKRGLSTVENLFVVDIGIPKVVFAEMLGIKWNSSSHSKLDRLYEIFTQRPYVALSRAENGWNLRE